VAHFIFKSEAQLKLEEIKEFRKKMKQVQDEARNKEELAKQLVTCYIIYSNIWISTFL
jgi:hypothetical protein